MLTASRRAVLRSRRAFSSVAVEARRGLISREAILGLPSMPAICPAFPEGDNVFINREYLIVAYESDPEAIRAVIPEPLESGNVVLYENINMPDSSGFGSYSEAGLVVPCHYTNPKTGVREPINFTLQMYLDCEPPTSGGRERWGFAKKIAEPSLKVVRDTLVGDLSYYGSPIARATMSYKHDEMKPADALASLVKLQSNLKLIPNPQWGPHIARLIAYNLCDVKLKFAYTGSARLELMPHVNAPMADLPIRRILGAKHICADITLPGGYVLHDYMKDKIVGDRSRMGTFSTQQVLNTVSIPHVAPSYTKGPARLTDRQLAFVRYRTDPELLRAQLPRELIANADGEVVYEVVSTHGSGMGSYSRCSQYIPCTLASTGEQVRFSVQGYVDNSSPITGGREVFGQPLNFAFPSLKTERDTVVAELKSFSKHTVGFGTIAYKHHQMTASEAAAYLATPQVNLKIIPSATGKGQDVAQLVRVNHTDIVIKSAWRGSARLNLTPHVNAPLADLPVRSVIEGLTMEADMTLNKGEVLVDYLLK